MLEPLLGFILFLLVIVVIILAHKYSSLKSVIRGQTEELVELKTKLESKARELYQAWRESELQTIVKQYEDVASEKAKALFDQWRQEFEDQIRRDAIERSQAVIKGKVAEHIAPFLSSFKYNPKDVRFIGSPVDLIVFDGLSESEPRKVVFIEVKTGASSLSERERTLRDIILQKKIVWEELHL